MAGHRFIISMQVKLEELLPKEILYFNEGDSIYKQHALKFLYSRDITDENI